MNEQIDQRIAEVSQLHSKLILLVGETGSGASRQLFELSQRRSQPVLNLGRTMGERLAGVAIKQRPLAAPTIFRELADASSRAGLTIVDHIELLFDRTLRLDPLDLLRQLARSRVVVASWPGAVRNERLVYAEMGHAEHQHYGIENLVLVRIPQE